MFHKAIDLKFLEGTALEVVFLDGEVKRYDMSALFEKYPQLRALEDRAFFRSGKLMGGYGIIWNDDLDIEVETIYQDGITMRKEEPANQGIARSIAAARAKVGMSQKQVATMAGIDQSDFSKIERGIGNPSVATLTRIARAMGGTLSVRIDV